MKQPEKLTQLSKFLKHKVRKEYPIWLTTLGVAGSVILLRWMGLLQPFELNALDHWFRLRTREPVDQRIVLVTIDDADINQIRTWPIPDVVMAQLLETIKAQNPRAIGLDIYRELPVEPGQVQLQQIFQTTPNLIGIEKIQDNMSVGVQPPPILAAKKQIGFNNVVVDTDGTVRRAVLFWHVDGQFRSSFALQLALLYLAKEGIYPQPDPHLPQHMRLGNATFARLRPDDGGYVRVDAGGYQILANPRGPSHSFERIPLREVLAGRIPDTLFRDRIVLIGSTAPSLRDFFYTSYSQTWSGNAQSIAGVELHANFISQILAAALEGRPLIQVLPYPIEWIWIVAWAAVGTIVAWTVRSPGQFIPTLLLATLGLTGTSFLAFLAGWWIPLVPPVLALGSAAITVLGYIAYLEEELKKSKEFLSSVIHTIPDPVFVKDKNRLWIVLNTAYSRFLGYPLEDLLNKSEFDFLPPEQANHARYQEDLIFTTGIDQESEEEFTDASGITHLIATKRSLHRDAAGNLFLVGVIRDITHRKRMEEELRRTAAELVRSNAELKEAEDRLRHMAYFDTLTGLPNRALFMERLTQALALAREHHQVVALLFLDLNGFKQINDTFGHQMGNLLLKAVAQRLNRCLRSSDTVARLGGDEFVVLLPAIPDPQDVARVAEKILLTFSNHFALEGKAIPVSTSIGISLYPQDGEDMDTLLKKADLAMYQAKGLGKNCYQFAQTE